MKHEFVDGNAAEALIVPYASHPRITIEMVIIAMEFIGLCLPQDMDVRPSQGKRGEP